MCVVYRFSCTQTCKQHNTTQHNVTNFTNTNMNRHRGCRRRFHFPRKSIVIAAFIYVCFIFHVEWIIKRKFYLPFTRNQLQKCQPATNQPARNSIFTTWVFRWWRCTKGTVKGKRSIDTRYFEGFRFCSRSLRLYAPCFTRALWMHFMNIARYSNQCAAILQ